MVNLNQIQFSVIFRFRWVNPGLAVSYPAPGTEPTSQKCSIPGPYSVIL